MEEPGGRAGAGEGDEIEGLRTRTRDAHCRSPRALNKCICNPDPSALSHTARHLLWHSATERDGRARLRNAHRRGFWSLSCASRPPTASSLRGEGWVGPMSTSRPWQARAPGRQVYLCRVSSCDRLPASAGSLLSGRVQSFACCVLRAVRRLLCTLSSSGFGNPCRQTVCAACHSRLLLPVS